MKKLLLGILAAIVLGAVAWSTYDANKAPDTSVTDTTDSRSVLNLAGSGLSAIGPDIYSRTDITELDVSNNNLTTLPSQMGKLTNLRVLRLDHNKLDGSLIAEVRKMPLVELDVSYNNMTGMPAEIGQLDRLETLNYSYNKLTGLPNELSNLKDTLKTFDLRGNPLSDATVANLRAKLPDTTILFD